MHILGVSSFPAADSYQTAIRSGVIFALLLQSTSTIAFTPVELIFTPEEGHELWSKLFHPPDYFLSLKKLNDSLFSPEPMQVYPLFDQMQGVPLEKLLAQIEDQAPHLVPFLRDQKSILTAGSITQLLKLLNEHESLLPVLDALQEVQSHEPGSQAPLNNTTWNFLLWLGDTLAPGIGSLLALPGMNASTLITMLFNLYGKLSKNMRIATASALKEHPQEMIELINDNQQVLFWLNEIHAYIGFPQSQLTQLIGTAISMAAQPGLVQKKEWFILLILAHCLAFRQKPFQNTLPPNPANYPNLNQALQEYAATHFGPSISQNQSAIQLLLLMMTVKPDLNRLITPSGLTTVPTGVQVEVFLGTLEFLAQDTPPLPFITLLLSQPHLVAPVLNAFNAETDQWGFLSLLMLASDNLEAFQGLLPNLTGLPTPSHSPDDVVSSSQDSAAFSSPVQAADNQPVTTTRSQLIVSGSGGVQTPPELAGAIASIASSNPELHELLVGHPYSLNFISLMLSRNKAGDIDLTLILDRAGEIIIETGKLLGYFDKRFFLLLLLKHLVESGLEPFPCWLTENIAAELSHIVLAITELLKSLYPRVKLDDNTLRNMSVGLVVLIQESQSLLNYHQSSGLNITDTPAVHLLPMLNQQTDTGQVQHVLHLLISVPALITPLNQFACDNPHNLPAMVEQLNTIQVNTLTALAGWQLELLLLALPVPFSTLIPQVTPNSALVEVIQEELQPVFPTADFITFSILAGIFQAQEPDLNTMQDKDEIRERLKKLLLGEPRRVSDQCVRA